MAALLKIRESQLGVSIVILPDLMTCRNSLSGDDVISKVLDIPRTHIPAKETLCQNQYSAQNAQDSTALPEDDHPRAAAAFHDSCSIRVANT